jgi:hypothetical protein
MSSEQSSAGRRAFIALGVGVILGGCVQDDTSGNRPETDSMITARGDVTIGIDSNKSEPQATETIGGGTSGRDQFEDDDTIFVWNDADTARRIDVIVEEKGTSGKPLFQETYRFEPDAYVTLDVSKSGEYVVSVGLDGETPETVDFAVDDCNDQSLFVTVAENGAVQSSSISTDMGCLTASMPQSETTTGED